MTTTQHTDIQQTDTQHTDTETADEVLTAVDAAAVVAVEPLTAAAGDTEAAIGTAVGTVTLTTAEHMTETAAGTVAVIEASTAVEHPTEDAAGIAAVVEAVAAVEATLGTRVVDARWPESELDTLPSIPGFILSDFTPLVVAVAERCLRVHHGEPPVDPVRAARTALVLASVRGDTTTLRIVTEAVAAGRRVPPLLFFQSNPNAVLGHVAARWGLGGPVVCVSPTGDPMADALASAELLFDAGDADEAVVIVAELGDDGQQTGSAEALLVTVRGTP